MPSLTSNLYEFGEFCLDTQNRVLRRGREPLPLTPKAFEVLLVLVQNGGRLVSKDELMKAVWPDSFVEESNLTQTVFMVRKALGETPDQRYILTIQGRGYRFAVGVKEVSNPRAEPIEAKSGSTSRNGGEVLPLPSAPRAIKSDRLWRKKSWLLFAGALGIILIAALAVHFRGSRAQSQQPGTRLMLAVLPFQNLTGDSTQDYFSDGLTEEMIMRLGSFDAGRLGVIARTSVMHYKNSQTPLDQIGRELGVQYVIEGSVRRDANDVRVTAQLIQVKDQTHLWARQYDRELKGLLALQGEIAQEIADEIQLTLGDRKLAAQPALSPQTYEAYDLYLKGQYFFNKRTVAGLEQAIGYFQQATAKDPNLTRAYAGLADSYALMPGYSGRPPDEYISKARAAALKALAVDESLPEAHTAFALIVQNYDWDWQTSEKEFRRAIELNPNYATAHHWYAEHLMWRGRFDEAFRESERARQLDPLSLIIAADNGAILFYSRQYDRAIEKWRSVLEMDPDFPRANVIMVAYVEKGMYAAALANVKKRRPVASAQDQWWYWSSLAYIYGRSGQTAEARHAFNELLQSNRRHPIDPRIIAWNYAGLGDKEQALAWLEKAYVQHSTELVSLKVNPGYDLLRGDPRFQDLLRRVGLEQ
jgi:TolB-like protein/DNA-binding winged helix-turn-helix (wHTH) protein/Tfp pilus assembly protein PilF